MLRDCQYHNSRLLQPYLDSLPCPTMLPLISAGHRSSSTLESRIEGVVWFSGHMRADYFQNGLFFL